jgi:DNA-binding transcriptional regulator YiaG
VRTYFIPDEPGEYSPKAVRKLRTQMAMTQGVFAKLIGVSTILVNSWERGVRTPSRVVRRLLDTIAHDPAAWLSQVQLIGRQRRAS